MASCFMLLISLAVIGWSGETWFEDAGRFFKSQLQPGQAAAVTNDQLLENVQLVVGNVSMVLIPAMVVIWLLVASLLVVQGGWVWAPKRVAWDASRLGPVAWQRQAVVTRFFGAFFGIGRLVFCIVTLGVGMWLYRDRLAAVSSGPLLGATHWSFGVGAKIAAATIAVMGVLASAEYCVRLWLYHQSLRMSSEELRDEQQARSKLRVDASLALADDVPQHRRDNPPS